MGIHGLMGLLNDEAPGCIKEQDIKAFTGRKVAIDASMALYQFLIAVRSAEHATGQSTMLTNEAGEVTSHIQGLFNRTIRMMTNGIKPCYVFDGKPPALKSGELAKRTKNRTKAQEELKAAEERDDTEAINKFSSRLVKVTREHNEDAKTLLRLMGVPVVEAPCEAEAQCAVLAKAGLVYAAGTEDMDALTFATPNLLKKLTFSSGQSQPIQHISYDKLLAGLGLSAAQFVDLCILCGCDYCDKIPGIGPKTALKLIKKHGTIEEIVKNIDLKKHPLPAGFEHPKAARARRAKEKKADAKKADSVPGFNMEASSSSSSSSASSSASSSSAAATASASEPMSLLTPVTPAPAKEETPAPPAPPAPAKHPEATPAAAAEEESGLVDSDDEAASMAMDEDAKPEAQAESTPAEEPAAAEEEDEAEEAEEEEEEEEEEDAAWEPVWVEVRRLFHEPEATQAPELTGQLKWTDPDEPGLVKFLVERMGFNEERVQSGIKRLKAAKTSSSQQRMDSFFKVSGVSSSTNKRKEPEKAKPKASKKGKIAPKSKK